MGIEKKIIKNLGLPTLFLLITMALTNCSKSDSSYQGYLGNLSISAEGRERLANTSNSLQGTLNTREIRSDEGFSYKINQILPNGDNANALKQSTLKLYENGVELGPAHAVHSDIRRLGKGRFSHWNETIFFSASDNSDPRTNGRTYTYAIPGENSIPSVDKPTSPTVPSTPTNSDMKSGLMGYAMVNGTTTGGAGGQEVTVTTLAALKSALSDNTPRIIYVSGTIKGAGVDPVYVKSNKSVIGKSGAVLQGMQFFVFGVNNIIFQNLTFRNYVTYAAIQIKEKAHHIWVDHCDFATDKTKGWDYWGKDITITRESDFVTVSWNKFHDTHLSVLISGGIKGHEADAGKLRVTMHHNFWYNVTEREPSMNYGKVHMFNNYHLNNSGYSIGTRAGGIVRTDNEYFSNCRVPLSSKINDEPDGYFSGINTNIYDKCGPNNITTAVSNWVPEYEYKSYLHPAADVPSIVANGAGPR